MHCFFSINLRPHVHERLSQVWIPLLYEAIRLSSKFFYHILKAKEWVDFQCCILFKCSPLGIISMNLKHQKWQNRYTRSNTNEDKNIHSRRSKCYRTNTFQSIILCWEFQWGKSHTCVCVFQWWLYRRVGGLKNLQCTCSVRLLLFCYGMIRCVPQSLAFDSFDRECSFG